MQDCSDCCIYRQYFPSVDYGKIGVLLLPEEKKQIENLAKIHKLKITILPRLGIGFNKKLNGPIKVIAYQLMGKVNGDYCPFLDTDSKDRSPHGGFNCQIYDSRPLSCRAYPVIKEHTKNVEMDSNCKFSCENSIWTSKNLLENELQALTRISNNFDKYANQSIWRYATHIGEEPFMELLLPQGWYLQKE
ncbi:MAG TPA: YkgJ family cysteine cluster protein [Nitrososphaeraceae archaeon]|nr:YkgJ family cysteine cluster protein [Nitrososphaeraceae archaeon]